MVDVLRDDQLKEAIQCALAAGHTMPQDVGESVLATLAKSFGQAPTAASRYRFVEMIGRGGMGTVWLAIDQDLGRKVAIKILSREFEISQNAIRRFVVESQIAGRLQHTGIVPVYELGVFPDGRVFLVMKLVTGKTLAELLRIAGPESSKLFSHFTSVCQTMAYSHSQGVIHRDLKPANIMVSEFNEVLVMDWGLARYIHKPEFARTEGETISDGRDNYGLLPQTKVGSVLGTPGYIAPEHSINPVAEWTTQSDVFSLGVIAYEILMGQRFLANGGSELTAASLSEALTTFDKRVPEPSLRKLIRDCLAWDRSERLPNASSVAHEVAAYHSELESRIKEAQIAQRTAVFRADSERRRRRLWLALFTTVGVASAAVTGIWVKNRLDTLTRLAAQQQRESEADHEIELLLRDANGFLVTGKREAAETLIRKAEGLTAAGSSKHHGTIQELLADLQMLSEIESIRLKRSSLVQPDSIPSSRPDRSGLIYDRGAYYFYSQAFQNYGIDLAQPNAVVVARLQSRSIRPTLVRALDEWANNAENRETQSRLRVIAEQVEGQPESITSRLRRAITKEDDREILSIANEIQSTDPSEMHFMVAHTLQTRGDYEVARKILTAAVNRYPSDFWLNLELGTVHALQSPKEPHLAQPWIAAAFALSHGNSDVYMYICIAQERRNLFAEAEISARSALAVTPNSHGCQLRLAYVLLGQKKVGEANRLLRECVAAEPNDPIAHFNLGVVQHMQPATLRDAINSYRKAAEFGPDLPEVWNNLGNALTSLRQYDEATKSFEKALAIRPNYARVLYNQGVMFDEQGRFTEAIAKYRLVMDSDPEFVEAAYNLAHDLTYQEGKFAAARNVLNTSQTRLRAIDAANRNRWERLIEVCTRQEKLEARLSELQKSKTDPFNAIEAADLAVLSVWPHRRQYVKATRYFELAFALQPKLADDLVQGYRYFAAGCAARAAAGLGPEAELLTDDDRNRFSSIARSWLKSDLAIRMKQLQSTDLNLQAEVKAKLRYWLSDANLAGIRDLKLFAKLSEAEQAEWQAFWQSVRNLAK